MNDLATARADFLEKVEGYASGQSARFAPPLDELIRWSEENGLEFTPHAGVHDLVKFSVPGSKMAFWSATPRTGDGAKLTLLNDPRFPEPLRTLARDELARIDGKAVTTRGRAGGGVHQPDLGAVPGAGAGPDGPAARRGAAARAGIRLRGGSGPVAVTQVSVTAVPASLVSRSGPACRRDGPAAPVRRLPGLPGRPVHLPGDRAARRRVAGEPVMRIQSTTAERGSSWPSPYTEGGGRSVMA